MSFLFNRGEYSNVIGTNKLRREAAKALKFESQAFAKTLGPYGENTIIESQTLNHKITKDGFEVYKNVVIYNKIGRVIARLIQKISGTLNENVGDGTTSSVVVAKEMYQLRKIIKKYKITPKLFTLILEEVSAWLISRMKVNAFDVTTLSEDIKALADRTDLDKLRDTRFHEVVKNLAAISLNNDYEKGQLIADIFSQLEEPGNGYINVDRSNTELTHYDKDRGFEIFRGAIDPELTPGGTIEWRKPKILLVKGQLATNDIACVEKVVNFVIGTLGQPLVIIAGGFSQALTQTILQSAMVYREQKKTAFPLLAIEVDNTSDAGFENFKDVEANVCATIIDTQYGKPFPNEKEPEMYIKYLGEAELVRCKGVYWTRILGGKRSATRVEARLAAIDQEIARLKSEPEVDHYHAIFKLNKRRACLLNDMITLNIGGKTPEEKETDAFLFDDAVRGCKSAINNGICRGGNLEVARMCYEILNNLNPMVDVLKDEELPVLVNLCMKKIQSFGISENKMKAIVIDMLRGLMDAYTRAFAIIVNNKFHDRRKSIKIARKCVAENQVYNLVDGTYESYDSNPDSFSFNGGFKIGNKVINSVDTDINILKTSVSILNLVITSNQFIRFPKREEMLKNM